MHDVNTKANQVIDKAVNLFLERIGAVCDKNSFRKPRTLLSTFSILKPANEAFYEYAYYERTLEWCTRELLINPILKGLFQIHGVETAWPDATKYIRYSTESIENVYPFEFIVLTNKKKIGVRYTGLCAGEAKKWIKEYAIDQIIQISWNGVGFREKEQKKYEVISPEVFFTRYFTQEDYQSFIEMAIPAMERANAEIGFVTIPRLSLRYLSSFKMMTESMLRKMKYEDLYYQILPDTKCKDDLRLSRFDREDYAILNENFISNGLYKALIGNEGFAKCFVTAEYQYQVFKYGNNFDYTSVACGYLKFIEQLVYALTQIRLQHSNGENLWIKCRSLKKKQRKKLANVIRWNPDPKSNATQIPHKAEYEPFFDITLKPLVWFIHDDEHGWCISDNGRKVVHKFLLNFADECRNDHFHKDNIDAYNVVTCIRNNTLLLAYLLLGGYKLTGNHQEDITILGIADDSFDRLYKRVQELPRGVSKFIVCFDGKEPIKAYRHFVQDPTAYDENGSVAASQIKFVAVDNFSGDEYDKVMQGKNPEKEFVLNHSNMPVQISYINGKNEEVLISW